MIAAKLDAMTLAFSMLLLQLVYILGFGIASINGKQTYIRKMAIGVFIMALGYLSVSLGQIALINVFLASSFLILGYSIMAFGVCDLLKQKINYKIFYILLINHILVYIYLTFINPIFDLRTSFFSLEIFLVATFISYVNFKYYKKSNDLVALFLSIVSLIKGCFHLWRISTIMHELNPQTLFRNVDMAKYVHIATILYNSTLCIVVIILATRIHSKRLIELNKELTELSYKDFLTKAYNLRYIIQKIEKKLGNFKNNAEIFSIAIVDIDFFKIINDTYGHIIGDEVLIKLVGIIEGNIDKSDICARYGGEEFLILFSNKSASEALKILENLQTLFKEYDWEHPDLKVSFSAGLIEINKENYLKEVKHLINDADKFLYLAKRNGRDRIEY